MRYIIFQKVKNKIQSVEVDVKKIGLYDIVISDGIDDITIQSNFKLDSGFVIEGPAITVIAAYILNGKLYPIGVDDSKNLESDDLLYLSSKIKGEVYNNPKVSVELQKQETAIAELRKLIEEKQILQKIADIRDDDDKKKFDLSDF